MDVASARAFPLTPKKKKTKTTKIWAFYRKRKKGSY